MGILNELTDSIRDTWRWVRTKATDAREWTQENPEEALFRAGLVFGGVALYNAATTASALPTAVEGVGVGASVDPVLANAGVSAGAADFGTQAATNAIAGESLGAVTSATPASTATAGLLESGASSAGADMSLSGGLNLPSLPSTVDATAKATQAATPFWDASNPYAWMVGGQALSGAGNMMAANRQLDEDKRRYNRKSYYGVSNNNRRNSPGVGTSAGLLNLNGRFSQAARPTPTYKPNPRRGAV